MTKGPLSSKTKFCTGLKILNHETIILYLSGILGLSSNLLQTFKAWKRILLDKRAVIKSIQKSRLLDSRGVVMRLKGQKRGNIIIASECCYASKYCNANIPDQL